MTKLRFFSLFAVVLAAAALRVLLRQRLDERRRKRGRSRRRLFDLEGAVQPPSRPGEEELQGAEASLPRRRDRAVRGPAQAGDAVPRPALRVQPAGGRAGRRGHRRRRRQATSDDQGAVLRQGRQAATRPARRSTARRLRSRAWPRLRCARTCARASFRTSSTTKVTADVTVEDSDIDEYYKKNKDQYVQPESRDVRHILVKKKALADDLYQQLTERRQLRGAREEVLAGPGLESIGRQADDLEGPAGARVRQVRLRARQ